jgi:hypothetical protein
MLQKEMAALKTTKGTTGADSMPELINLGVEYLELVFCVSDGAPSMSDVRTIFFSKNKFKT